MSEGFLESRRKLVLVGLVAAGIIGFSLLVAKALGARSLALSLGETFTACFGGIHVFDPERDRFFQFPAAWMLMLAAIAYVTLSYPYRDLMGFGRSVLVSSGSRRSWWTAKCMWVLAATLACCLLVTGVCVLATVVLGGSLSMSVSRDAFIYLLRFPPDGGGLSMDLTVFVLVIPCMMAALCLMQLAVSLVTGPVLSYGVTLSVLLASAYVFSPLLPGNYLMVARTDAVVFTGTSPLLGLALALAIAVASVVLGGLYFSHMDCMDKEYSA